MSTRVWCGEHYKIEPIFDENRRSSYSFTHT
jgi:hypothetical protein